MVFNRANVLLPANADMSKWSVVACDQYTSEPKYWEDVENFVGTSPSAYNLILPEMYLQCGDVGERIEKINSQMNRYLSDGVFASAGRCYIYVERTLRCGKVRKGVVGCVDLECYDYMPGSKSAVRPTEKTVVERIPPRLRVRENAPVELPHIMLLADDPNKILIEPLGEEKSKFEKLYDFDLMMSSGHITGYKLDDETASAFENKLLSIGNDGSKSALVFAVGDGNHSLATAKACYRNLKDKIGDAALASPARYALAELVNLHDDSLEFEAIHRVVFGVDRDKFTDGLLNICTQVDSAEHDFTLVTEKGDKSLKFNKPDSSLAVGCIQNYIDAYLAENGGSVDYIHGEDVARELAGEGNVAIVLDAMKKSDLFKTVTEDGVLPRKTFSMGEACDKRFYVEARKIK